MISGYAMEHNVLTESALITFYLWTICPPLSCEKVTNDYFKMVKKNSFRPFYK